MSNKDVLARSSFGQFLDAKVEHWVDKDPKNAASSLALTAISLSMLAAGTEIAANLFKSDEHRNKRLALHLGTIGSLASAVVTAYVAGVITGENPE